MHINDLLKVACDQGASDLHLKVGSHPVIRVDGRLTPLLDSKRLLQEDTISMAFAIMSVMFAIGALAMVLARRPAPPGTAV